MVFTGQAACPTDTCQSSLARLPVPLACPTGLSHWALLARLSVPLHLVWHWDRLHSPVMFIFTEPLPLWHYATHSVTHHKAQLTKHNLKFQMLNAQFTMYKPNAQCTMHSLQYTISGSRGATTYSSIPQEAQLQIVCTEIYIRLD